MRLLPDKFVIKYHKGVDTIADFWSTHLCKNTEYRSLAEEYVNFMIEYFQPIAPSMSKLVNETIRDDIMQSVIKLVNTTKWEHVTDKRLQSLRTCVMNLLLQMIACNCVTHDWLFMKHSREKQL